MACQLPQDWKAPLELRQMLLDIAYSVADSEVLSFIAFAKLTVAILDDAIEPAQVSESIKAVIVHELWRDFACGRRRLSL